MLAYELFLNNKESQTRQVKDEYPIKKIFYINKKITLDTKTIEHYGGGKKPNEVGCVQELLQMPLNTVNTLNLPDRRTGAASPNPYVEIYAVFNKSNLELLIGKKSNEEEKNNFISYILNLENYEQKKDQAGTVSLKLDRKKYWIDSNILFDEYVKSGIINGEGILNVEVYENIVNTLFEFVKKKQPNCTNKSRIPFRIFILPSKDIIEYRQEEQKKNEPKQEFIDYFGNTSSSYPKTPTKTAKFLTYDDPAFSLNCKQRSEFYKNLGIGDKSMEKIYVNSSQKFKISGLEWTFTNISDPNFKFEETKKGFLYQIHNNYQKIKRDKGKSKQPQMKILCMQINQAKQEVIIDENLTLDRMEKLFGSIENIQPVCFEIFIDNSSAKSIWNTYIYIIKNFLAGHKIQKDYMLSFFNKTLRRNIFKWIKTNTIDDQKDFFNKSDFCLKTLCIVNDSESYMDSNESYAESIGKIARAYIDFKQEGSERDNSLLDILTYSKYDREKLRFILSRIGRGINLSKISDKKKTEITEKVSSLQPNSEISDDVSTKDYSYFFFKGYYNSVEVTA